MTEPCHLTATEARRLIGLKKLSPVELTDSCLKRIAAVNPAVNAIVALDEDMARAQAKDAERLIMNGGYLDVLHGLPVGMKDLHAVEGLRSTWGSPIYADNVPEQDDAFTAQVRVSGGLIFCRTNVPEFGAGANTNNVIYGPTGNPFDPTLTAAGSSGGSAAAIALDMLPLATGSDYAGSCRTPAAFCGVAGMRTSPGLLPMPDRPGGLLAWGVAGPMGRTVEDMHLAMRAMVTVDRRDPYSSMDGFEWPERLLPTDLASLRMAYSPDLACAPVDDMIRKVFVERVATFGKAFLDASDATPDFNGIHDIFEVHRGLSFVAAHQDRLRQHPGKLGPHVMYHLERGQKLSASEIGRAFVEQQALSRRVHAFFDDFDVLIAPAAAVSPFPHAEAFPAVINGERLKNYSRWLALAYAPTMAFCCAIALPCGRDENGLPFGIQLIAPRGHDKRLMEVALALEQVMASDPATARPIPSDPVAGAAKKPAAKKAATKSGKAAR